MTAPGALTGVLSTDASGTSIAVALTAGTADKVILLGIDGSHTPDTPSGWTKLATKESVTGVAPFVFYWRANTSDTSVTISWTGTERASALGGTSPDTDFSTDPPVESTGVTGGNAAPDPDDLTGLTSGDYRILAIEGHDRANGFYHAQTGEVIVQGCTGLPIFIGIMQFTTQAVIKPGPRHWCQRRVDVPVSAMNSPLFVS